MSGTTVGHKHHHRVLRPYFGSTCETERAADMLVLFVMAGDRCCLLAKLSDRRSRRQIGLVCLHVFEYERVQCVCLTCVVVTTFCLLQMWTQLRGTARECGTHDGAGSTPLS